MGDILPEGGGRRLLLQGQLTGWAETGLEYEPFRRFGSKSGFQGRFFGVGVCAFSSAATLDGRSSCSARIT